MGKGGFGERVRAEIGGSSGGEAMIVIVEDGGLRGRTLVFERSLSALRNKQCEVQISASQGASLGSVVRFPVSTSGVSL